MRPFHLIALTGLVLAAATGCSDSSGPKGAGKFALAKIDNKWLPQNFVADSILLMYVNSGVTFWSPIYRAVGQQTLDATSPNKWTRVSSGPEGLDPHVYSPSTIPDNYIKYLESSVTDSGTYARRGPNLVFYKANGDSIIATREGNTMTWTEVYVDDKPHTFLWNSY